MSTPNPELDIQRLRKVVAKNPRYRPIFETYLERQRGRQDSTPSRMRRVLRELNKGDYPLEELAKFFEDMQAVGAGRWIAGRHGKEGRFAWGFHLVSVAEAVLDKKAPVSLAAEAEKEEAKTPLGGLRPVPEKRKRLPRVIVSEPEVALGKPAPKSKAVAKDVPVSAQTQPAPVPSPSKVSASASALPAIKIQWGPAPHEYVEMPVGLPKDARDEIFELVERLRASLR